MTGGGIRVRVVRPEGLAAAPDLGDTCGVDPVVAALAQLVRDRWAREQAGRVAARERLRVVRRTEG